MDPQELLRQDLIKMMISRPTRAEAEILAGQVIDSLSDMMKEVAEKAVDDHAGGFQHNPNGDY